MKSLSYKRIYKSQEYLATLGTIEYRSLFGSYSLTVDDTVFAMVSDGELYLRACGAKCTVLCKTSACLADI